MESLSDSIIKIAKAMAETHFMEVRRSALAGNNLEVAMEENERDRLNTASCFLADEVEFFNETYYSEYRRLSSVEVEDAIARSKASIDNSPPKPADVEVRKIDRLAVRKLVQKNVDELHACSCSGTNAHQKALDQQDVLAEMVACLSVADQEAFYRVYAEEMNANTAQVEIQTSKLLLAAAQSNESAEMVGKAIGVIIIIAIVIFAFSKIFR